MKNRWLVISLALALCTFFSISTLAQETTGGLQGTVKDPTGAVVPNAQVVIMGTALVGKKELTTDSSGYYRFANLPPGTYNISVTAKGFRTLKREGMSLEVGHLPTVDFSLEVGAASEVIEVSGAAPVIDVTTNLNQTNVTSDIIDNIPHGYSFQSMITIAPMARAEPLLGGSSNVGAGGTGGFLPGSSGNGSHVGYSVGGSADSESSYLVEGQDTENISGGISQANVPFQFIQEVQVTGSGISAEHGGALGGVINVVMQKGGNGFHGSLFTTYESDQLSGSQNATLRYDPLAPKVATPGFDRAAQTYQPKRDHYRIAQPGFTVGGPIMKDRLWFFLGFAPEYNSTRREVNFTPSSLAANSVLGNQVFTQDNQQYFTTARLDAALTQKIRLYGSWLYQYTRETGADLPRADSVNGLLNTSINSPLTQYSHGLGFAAPNATYNVGADISLTPKVVATTRYGYFFNNYHDFGWPTKGVDLSYIIGGQGQFANCTPQPCTPSASLPAGDLQVPNGASTTPYNQAFTEVNASKHYQFDQDVAFFKGGWWGTHNIKMGYQYNRLSNVINQHGNVPLADVFVGAGVGYGASTAFGGSNCDKLVAAYGVCAGQFGYLESTDFSTVLRNTAGAVVPAIDTNHAFFVQDSWTVGHGLTLNLGLRIEKEDLPAPPGIGISGIRAISFSWGDKVEPRLGAAWGSRNGKLKIFGSYGVVNDVMKLLLAQTSFGAQGWDQCTYAVGPNAMGGFSNSDITLTPDALGRACPTAPANVGARFANGVTPVALTDAKTGVSLIENTNFRPEEPVAPGVKPYRQHEYVAGVDYQIAKDWAFEARYNRRRLDHAIEDASLADPFAFEIYTIVNPGQGVNKTIDGYASFLTSLGAAYGPGVPAFNGTPGALFGTCPTCPANPQAIRNYDGVELRVTHTMSKHWAGMFSYTWSSLWGNYAGLTTTDQIDGGVTGRNSPDTSRSFDEPFYYFGANGKSNDGPMPTDRPNTLNGNVYYQLPWKGMTTTLGLFQVAYQGSPVSAYADLGYAGSSPVEATYIFGRGNWVNIAQNPATGALTLGTPYAKRTPWYTQTDLHLSHSMKVNKNNERQVLSFSATAINLLNQHAVVGYWQGINSNHFFSPLFPFEIFNGASFYKTAETGYNAQTAVSNAGVILNSRYGQPNLWQISRSMRLGVQFTF
jgi:Carboxypeptidase regulatory-like domain